LRVAFTGPRTSGPMAPEIPLEGQRPAQYVFAENVQLTLTEMRRAEAEEKAQKQRKVAPAQAPAESSATAA
jgi:hypothetical protein